MLKTNFKEEIYEIAFGDDAINRGFSEEEVIKELRQFSRDALNYKQLEEINLMQMHEELKAVHYGLDLILIRGAWRDTPDQEPFEYLCSVGTPREEVWLDEEFDCKIYYAFDSEEDIESGSDEFLVHSWKYLKDDERSIFKSRAFQRLLI